MTASGSAWTGDELVRTGRHLVTIGEATVEALAHRLPKDFRPPEPDELDVFRSRVARPLGDVAAEVEQRLEPDGPGLAIVVGEGLEALTDGQLTALTLGMSVLLGQPMAQNSENELVVSVRDERPEDPVNARGYQSNGRMQMHTDPTDVAGLLCVHSASTGGESWFSSGAAVHDALAREAPDLLPQYFRPWGWDLRGLQRPGAERLVTTPVFSLENDDLYCRFGMLMLREGERAMGGLTAAADAALVAFDEVAQRPDLTLRHSLRRGESAWFDNYRILHGREAFEDQDGTDQVRHLLRTWVWRHDRPSLSPGFTAFSAAMDRS